MIKKILIANRGEIAIRVIKTARKLGIKTVAVYSEADVNSLVVQEADEAYFVGAAPSSQSYLVIDKIIAAIKESGADAVHPGYGFLSENCEFARRLKEINVTFIGPSEEAIKAMGDKITSKKIAKEAGVNTVPGYMGIIKDGKEAVKIAKDIGFPVMVKATAGGGGKGMRIVHSEKEVESAFKSATNEAANSFGDSRIFIEKFIEKPRHIEIQVLADQHGNVICLGERECSIQRYNQKVIEEAPSPMVSEKMRKEMYSQSVKLAKQVGYYSAGTVEYIVDSKSNFYFLEMNTRLQVEHPVTELITGLDLVEQMINVADGKKLSLKQSDVKLTGWAMESRIYAEDPTRGFLPSSGRISKYCEPQASDSVRIDSGVYEGAEISMFYDPMIAKLCSYGKDRKSAAITMQNALSEFVISGISHNINFLESIFHSKRFLSGELTTNYISEEYPDGFKLTEIADDSQLHIICAAAIIRLNEAERFATISGKVKGREKDIGSKWAVCIGQNIYLTQISRIGQGSYVVNVNGQDIEVKSNWSIAMDLFKAVIDGVEVIMQCRIKNDHYIFSCQGKRLEVLVVTPRVAELNKYMLPDESDVDLSVLTAPISGKIVSVQVAKGDKVKAGSELLVIEAMKMENAILAESDVVIESVHIKAGDTIQSDEEIIKFA